MNDVFFYLLCLTYLADLIIFCITMCFLCMAQNKCCTACTDRITNHAGQLTNHAAVNNFAEREGVRRIFLEGLDEKGEVNFWRGFQGVFRDSKFYFEALI